MADDIKEAADILVARVHRDEEVLTVIGTTAAVKHAEIVLNTQVPSEPLNFHSRSHASVSDLVFVLS